MASLIGGFYRSNSNTASGVELACASMAVLASLRICALANDPVVVP